MGNIDNSVPTLATPTIVTSSPNEARHPTVEAVEGSSPLSPLGITEIPSVTHEFNRVTSTGFLKPFDQQTDMKAPHRRRGVSNSPSYRSQPLPPPLEDPLHPNIQAQLRVRSPPSRLSTGQSTSSSRMQSRSSTSGSSTSGSSKLFGNNSSQTTPDTSSELNSDLPLPGTSSRRNSLLPSGAPRANFTSLNRRTRTTKTTTLPFDLPLSHNCEYVSPVVLRSMEMAASDSEPLCRPARDGTVSAGNLEGLVSRVITDIVDPSRNDLFWATFLTIYQLFATSERLFDILKRRFESSELDPVSLRSRYP